jgi:tetratricopeptide (TPR) repeat protein
MSAADDSFASKSPEGAPSQAAIRRLAGQRQLDFDLEFYESILRRAPRYVDVLRCQGELLNRKGLHERAVLVDRQLAELLPQDCVVRYNLACSLARIGRCEEAIESLRKALEQGYRDFDYLHADGDLDALRGEPAFERLLQEYEAA